MIKAVDAMGTPEWKRLAEQRGRDRDTHLRGFFADDPERGRRMTVEAGELRLDYSKHRLTHETVDTLVALAARVGVERWRDAMFSGEHINTTEDRAVLHVALRMPPGARLQVDGQDVVSDVHRVLETMGSVADRIRTGARSARRAGPSGVS